MEVSDLKEQAQRVRKLKRRKERAERISKKCSSEYESERSKMKYWLENLELDSFRDEGIVLSVRQKQSAKIQDKAAFYEFLREIGAYEELISVNSQTLSKFAREFFEKAEEDGELFPEVPGLVVNEYTELSVTTK